MGQALNQQQIRQELKSILGASNPKDQAITQKVLEEYLNRQKQGLVENIVSQYSMDAQNMDQINFSNFIIQSQTQMQKAESVGQSNVATNLIDNPNQVEKALMMGLSQQQQASPSKKHRHLIQTRKGAAQYQQQNPGN